MNTIKLRAVDRSTIQFLTLLAKGHSTYSSVPSRRVGQNKSEGGKIFETEKMNVKFILTYLLSRVANVVADHNSLLTQ